jgi:hypothetical protein
MTRKLIAAAMVFTGVTFAQKIPKKSDLPAGEKKTVKGLVRDIACPIQNKESTATRFNLECAIQCAKLGSPLAILTDDGTMYLPISNVMPDSDQRQKLMPLVGKYVVATGELYERNGTRAIVLSEIKEDKSKHLSGDAFQPE